MSNNKRVNSMEGVKIGDQVWSLDYGWGVVSDIDTTEEYAPIRVKLENGGFASYTTDGYGFKNNALPSLFFDEIQLTVPKRPKKLPKKGQPILVKDFPTAEYRIRVFSHLDTEGRVVTFTFKYPQEECEGTYWNYWEEFDEKL